jgi:gliding motility-associated-like protein
MWKKFIFAMHLERITIMNEMNTFLKQMLTRVKTVILLVVFVVVSEIALAQNNYPDNIVVADCSTETEAIDWGVHVQWSSTSIVSNLVIPLVGDLDGDGHPEVLCFAKDGDFNLDPRKNNKMLVFDGVTKQLKAAITLPAYVTAFDAAAYGLVRLPEGPGLIVVACYDYKLRAYDITADDPATPYWVSDTDFGNSTGDYAVNLGFADFNGDGTPEVFIRNKIYNASNGKLLATANTTNAGASYAHFSHVTHWKLSSPVVADMCNDSLPELILGNQIYSVNITNTNGTSGNSMSLLQQTSPPAQVPTDGHPQVADFNQDGFLDVLITVRTSDMHPATVYGYVWDVHNQTVSTPFTISTSSSGKSIPLIADIDNDGALEVIIQCGASDYNRFRAYKYDAISQTFSLLWGLQPNEDSYSNGITAFDFNLDGLLELIICDQSTLKIVNGSGKSHLTHNDTVPVYTLGSFPFSEVTIMQYPVIADVDADGAAEIVSVGSNKLNILKSTGQPWAPARPVWNQYMYNVTNINKDLTVPTALFNNATAFTDPQGVVRRPFNHFLQQVTTLDQYGRPFMPLANVSATADTTFSYENGVLTYTFQFCNMGGQVLTSPFHITYYANNYGGTVISTETVSSTLMPGDCITWEVQFSETDLMGIPDLENIVVALNDHGTGVGQNGGQQEECDTTDNFFTFSTDPCNIPKDTVIADVCVREPYSDENFDIPATETEEAGTYFFSRVFQVRECDSVIVLKLQVHPRYDLYFTETIPEGTAYDRHGIFLNESMLESGQSIDTSITHQSVYGCDSITHVTIHVAASEITIYLPNAITPSKPDGLNDKFSLPEKIRNQIADFEIMIFNRWGEMVFYSNDKGFSWDGDFKGKTFYDNVYQYIIHYSNPFGKKFTQKGTVTVL